MTGATWRQRLAVGVLAVLLMVTVAAPASARRSIVKGGSVVSTAGAWPWTVLVIASVSSSQTLCTGVLIGPATVLTADHCADPQVLGSGATFQVTNARNIQDVSSSNSTAASVATLDSQFDPNNPQNGNDLAVLALAKPLAGTSYLPVLQPSQVSPFEPSFDGLLAGYGVNSGTDQTGQTAGTLRQTDALSNPYNGGPLITNGSSPAYACEGDSGGPLIVSRTGATLPVMSDPMPSNGRWAVIGLVSFGDQMCSAESDFTALPAYSSFLLPYETPMDYVRPAITGRPVVGQRLTCGAGTWSVTITPTYRWETVTTGAPTPITGATASTFTPTSAQVGKKLECLVTASALGFGAPNHATSGVVGPVALPAPVLTSFKQSHARWKAGSQLPKISAAAAAATVPVGTTFTFSVSQPSALRLVFKRPASSSVLSLRAPSGPDKLTFQGRLSSTRRLAPGTYTVTITATNAAGKTSRPQSLTFTIVP